MCNLDIWLDIFDDNTDQTFKSQTKTRKLAWELIKELFGKKERDKIKETAIAAAKNSFIAEEIEEITKND